MYHNSRLHFMKQTALDQATPQESCKQQAFNKHLLLAWLPWRIHCKQLTHLYLSLPTGIHGSHKTHKHYGCELMYHISSYMSSSNVMMAGTLTAGHMSRRFRVCGLGFGGPWPQAPNLDAAGSWRKARGLLAHPKLAKLRRVQLPLNFRSTFW
jgi:hypothetical protein